MPKRISKKTPKDANQLAYQIVRLSTGENVPVGQDTLTKEQVSALMADMGRRGGRIGGKRRLETMTASQRKAAARRAANARWKAKD